MLRQIICLILAIPFAALGSSLILKAGIGVGAWDALSKCAAQLCGIKIGTLGMMTNSLCVIGQILLLKKAFKPLQLLQFGMAFLLGSLVNFFYYDVLSQLAVPAYSLSIVFLLIGNGINAAAVALILSLNIVTFPVGGLVLAVSQVTNSAYGKCRQGLDGICILIILILVFGFHGEMTLREGTFVSMLMFGPLVDRFMSLFQIYLKKGARI